MKITVTDQSFETAFKKYERAEMIEFFASWCHHCKHMAGVVNGLAKSYAGQIAVLGVNVETAPETARRFGVQGVPAFVFVKNGEIPLFPYPPAQYRPGVGSSPRPPAARWFTAFPFPAATTATLEPTPGRYCAGGYGKRGISPPGRLEARPPQSIRYRRASAAFRRPARPRP